MDVDKDLKARVLYLLRAHLYYSAQALSLEGIRSFPADPVFHMYNGWSLALGGRPQEAIRELEILSTDKEVSLGTTLSLLHAHKKCSTIDQEAVSALDARLKEERRSAGEFSLYHAAYFLFLAGRIERAKEYADRLLKSSPQSARGLTVRGWIELQLLPKAALDLFAKALDQDKAHLDALYGGVRAREKTGDHIGAVSALNQLVVRFPGITPPLIEKARNQLAQRDWDQTAESAVRALAIDPDCINALQIKAMLLVCKDGDYEEGSGALRRLIAALEKAEPKNVELFLENAQLFSRICGRNPTVLTETYRLAEWAAKTDPGGAASLRELGQQCLLLNRMRDGVRHFRAATRADESSVTALVGLTMAQLADSSTGSDRDQAQQQVDFLLEVQGGDPSAEVLLMAARLSADRPDHALQRLDAAVKAHMSSLDGSTFGLVYLRALNPDLLLQIVHEYQRQAPELVDSAAGAHAVAAAQIPNSIRECLSLLRTLREACPGLLAAHLLLARTLLMAGDSRGAQAALRHVVDYVDETAADAHLLLAQAQLRQGNILGAAQSLEVAVSHNFAIRDRPLFHLLTGMVQRYKGDLDEAVRSLTTAQTMSGLRPGAAVRRPSIGVANHLTGSSLSRSELVSVLLELSASHQEAGRAPEALLAIQDATNKFRGTSEEGRIAIAQADMMLAKGDSSGALSALGDVLPSELYYFQARNKMADIHLRVRKDRRAYAEVFKQLVDHNPTPQSLVLLGDAYLGIQEPEKAIEAYEQALKRAPGNGALACKIGRALVQTHQYGKAVNYYREAVRSDTSPELRLDMAILHLKLGQLDKADATLAQELTREVPPSDLEALITRTKMQELLAKVKEKSGNIPLALTSLQEARQNQARVLKLVVAQENREDSPAVLEQRKIGARLCRQMALHAASLRDYSTAVRHYREALALQSGSDADGQASADNADTLVALAKLYMQIGDLEPCQTTCQTLLAADAENDAATVMMADLAFRKVDLDGAWQHFSSLLLRRPAYWTALARLVEVSRRRGQLGSSLRFLEAAEQACQRPAQEPGLNYCRGLYAWYAGNGSQALRLFNAARRDNEWGQQAVHNMIEICLDPEGGALGEDAASEERDARQAAITTAQRLLTELRNGGPDEELNKRLLANSLLLATGSKHNIEKAVQDLTAIVSAETEAHREPVGAVLGLANGLLLQKQTQRARNQLKRVARTPWTVEQSTHLERAWLLLADMYVQQGKQDLAAELLRRVLDHNQGCTRAYEYLGLISEKESAYREAAQQYERAWRLGGGGGSGADKDAGRARSNPALGYKLAFNYMKCKRYADAIDVCQQVLSAHPDYPRIRKEILDKSRCNLRT